ncbi:MAG: GyrI-like domain-containing protein [Dehalococcoidia bacterium]
MHPEFVKKPEMTLVGFVGCGADVSQLDICGLWKRFDAHSKHIKNQVEDRSYEIHIQEETAPPMHFCLVGVEVSKLDDLRLELFAKVVPACEYAVFTHRFRDGGFGHAFKAVYNWLENSEYAPAYPFDIQCYDSRFKGPEDPESILEIWVPVKPGQR